MRDVEDLVLKTIKNLVVVSTGIPASGVWLKRPAMEFVNQQDGPNVLNQQSNQFPAVGINYLHDANFRYNNYGGFYNVVNVDGTSTTYQPLGEIDMFLGISFFTTSKTDMRRLTNIAELSILNNSLKSIDNDIVPGTFFRMDLVSKKIVNDSIPFHEILLVKVNALMFAEIVAPTVHTIDTSLAIGMPATNNVSVLTVQGPSGVLFEESSTGAIWYNPNL